LKHVIFADLSDYLTASTAFDNARVLERPVWMRAWLSRRHLSVAVSTWLLWQRVPRGVYGMWWWNDLWCGDWWLPQQLFCWLDWSTLWSTYGLLFKLFC